MSIIRKMLELEWPPTDGERASCEESLVPQALSGSEGDNNCAGGVAVDIPGCGQAARRRASKIFSRTLNEKRINIPVHV
jgi:hypothetical protein